MPCPSKKQFGLNGFPICVNQNFCSLPKYFGPKTTIFAPKYAFLGTYRPCRLIWLVGWWLWCTGCISQDTYLLYDIRPPELLHPPKVIRMFGPKTTIFAPKYFLLGHKLASQAHLVPCLLVCWWLWRVGCISQDAYSTYVC